jgi:hypothetical protein
MKEKEGKLDGNGNERESAVQDFVEDERFPSAFNAS